MKVGYERTISVEEAAKKKYVVLDDKDGDYALLVSITASSDKFVWSCLNDPTTGIWNGNYKTIKEAIIEMLEDGCHVEAFDTCEEVVEFVNH